MSLRSFNPALAAHFKSVPRLTFQYGFKNIVLPETCQQIIDAAKLREKYPNSKGNLDIIDVFSGYGLLLTMINHELQPRNHIIVDNTKENTRVWESRIAYLQKTTGNRENFRYFNLDGYSWDSYDHIIKRDRAITPKTCPDSMVHDELLIIGNLSSNKTGESLFAQWVQCSAFGNWLHRYGRVRMLLLAREHTALKFLSGPNCHRRNRLAMRIGVYTDSRLVALSDESSDSPAVVGARYDPNVLVRDQPITLPVLSMLPSGGDLALVEVVPRAGLRDIDVSAFDYIAQILMYKSCSPLREALPALAPGGEDLVGLLDPEILAKTVRALLREDLLRVLDVYLNWAFRPSYEDTLTFLAEETRHF